VVVLVLVLVVFEHLHQMDLLIELEFYRHYLYNQVFDKFLLLFAVVVVVVVQEVYSLDYLII
jgi:hypothetical protein